MSSSLDTPALWHAVTMSREPATASHDGLHGSVLDALGQDIVSGATAVDSVLRIDQLDERFGVSRSVVREAVRVLSSMGLVETRRRLGVRVRPRSEWNVFDPRIIRWRLAGPDREDQLVSLGELRRGFGDAHVNPCDSAKKRPDQPPIIVGPVRSAPT